MSVVADRQAELSPQGRATRALIIDTAERLFRTLGYGKTTVADIARELKMSPANVYRFFASKAAINEAIAERLFASVEARIIAIVRARRPAGERLVLLFRALFEETRGRYIGESKVHDMVTAAMEEQWPAIQAHIDRLRALMRELIADGVARGEFLVDDLDLATDGCHNAAAPFYHPQMVCQCLLERGDAQVERSARFILAALTRQGV